MPKDPAQLLRQLRGRVLFWIILFLICGVGFTWLSDELLSPDTSQLQTFTNIITIMTSVALLAIALAVYKRFSSSQAITDKQTRACIDLIRTLDETTFSLAHYRDGLLHGRLDWGPLPQPYYDSFGMDARKKFIKKYAENLPQYAHSSLADWQEYIRKLSYDPYIPEVVASVAKHIPYANLWPIKPEEESFCLITVSGGFGFVRKAPSTLPISHKNMFISGDPFELEGKDTDPVPGWDNTNDESPDWPFNLMLKFKDGSGDLESICKNMRAVVDAALAWLQEHNNEVYSSLNIVKPRKPKHSDKS